MRRLTHFVFVLAFGCQEFGISKSFEVGEPIDTDAALAVDLPDIEVSPETLDFGELPIGCPSEPEMVTIRNVGDTPLHITEIVIAGPQAELYELFGGGTGNILPGEAIEVEVVFTPPGNGSFPNASVMVSSNDPDESVVHVRAGGEGSDNPYREDLFTQEISNHNVDVLFVVDDSESMVDNIHALSNAMSSFIQQFLVLGLDYQIGVTTTDMSSGGARGYLLGPVINNFSPDPVGEFGRQVDQGAMGSPHEVGFAASMAALSAPLVQQGPNADLLREDANLAVVVISDEDDSDASSTNRVTPSFIDFVLSLKSDPGEVSFSGLVGPARTSCGGFSGTNEATPAPEYHRAIIGTGGAWGNICQLDIVPFLEQLSLVVAGLDSRFTLSGVPTNTACHELQVTVDGVAVPCGQYTYHPSTNEIELSEGWVPEEGEGVIVTYPTGGACF